MNALARVRIEDGRVAGVECAASAAGAAVVAAVPWFALEPLWSGDVAPMAPIVAAASRMASKPIVTVNLWYDRAVMDDVFVGLPGREMQWVFDKRRVFGEAGVAPVAGRERRRRAGRRRHARRWSRWPRARSPAAIPGARDARPDARHRRPREARDVLAGARPAGRARASTTPGRGPVLAGDWIETGLPGTIESAAVAGHHRRRRASLSQSQRSSIERQAHRK